MADEPEDFTDERAKHLGMIQDVVERMAMAAAWMKRLAIVVVGGAAAVATKNGNGNAGDLPVLAVILVAIFWLMDARYHQQERWFRDVFESVRKEPYSQCPDFRINPDHEIRGARGMWPSMFTWSTFPFYAALSAFLILAWRLGHVCTWPS